MPSENNEYKLRQQQRAAARRKKEMARRRLRVRALLALAVAVACGVMLWLASSSDDPAAPSTPVETTTAPAAQGTQPVLPKTGRTVIHIAAAGDLNINDATIAAGSTPQGYDYGPVFLDVMPALSTADLTLINLEGNLVGAPYGTERRSAPPELMEALANAGVDMVQMANSTSIHNGLLGLADTLDAVRAAGMEPVGAFKSKQEFKKTGGFTMANVGGIKVAFVAFTKGMDNLGLPSGSEDCVNVLYDDYATTYQEVATEKITKILGNVAAAKPDFTIALLHWGSEYNDELSSTQEEIRDLMFANGVDAILGTHPHLVQQVEFDREKGTFVAYSLGDFFNSCERSGSNYSMILDLEITRDNETGETRLTDYSYTPIYTATPEESGEAALRLHRIRPALESYDPTYYRAIPKTLVDNMTYCLDRLESRVNGEG